MLGGFSLADDFSGFKSVHAGHVHIEQNDGKIRGQDMAKRFASGIGADDVLAEVFEHGFEREELLRPVIDQKEIDFAIGFTHSNAFRHQLGGL